MQAPYRDLAAELHRHLEQIDELVGDDPGLTNVLAYELAWRSDPAFHDFLAGDSPLGRLKRLERDLYLEHIGDYLEELVPGARVLDAGCGAGRFSEHLARRAVDLTLVDAAPSALRAALRVAERERGPDTLVQGHLADVRDLGFAASGTFDAVLAMELLCYQRDPEVAIAELSRVMRPGGLLFLSVEGRFGGVLQDASLDPSSARRILDGEPLHRQRDVYVRHYTPDGLRDLVTDAGLESLLVAGCHYVPDGPLDRLVDWERLADPVHRTEIVELEHRCAADPVMAPLARAWVGVARRPET
ncbi:MAG: class I SAM-dependent methyltransferase [Myxococcota bacterium]